MAELLPLVQPPLMSDNARRVVDTIERVCTSRLAEYLISLLASEQGVVLLPDDLAPGVTEAAIVELLQRQPGAICSDCTAPFSVRAMGLPGVSLQHPL